MAQMNPLIGPRLHQGTLYMIAKEWDGRDLLNENATAQSTGPAH